MPSIKNHLTLLARPLLQFFFPRLCPLCEHDVPSSEPHAVCAACTSSFAQWDGLICVTCGLPLRDGGAHCYVCQRERRSFKACRSAGIYEGPLRQCLLLLKYGGKDYLAKPLARFMARCFQTFSELTAAQAVVPVPLHFWRRATRGYNQAELLAQAFCRETGLPLYKPLKRHRWSPSQTSLSKEDRKTNVASVFSAKASVRGKTVLLIDDICTTGATLNACAQALKTAGAKQVLALTVARQV